MLYFATLPPALRPSVIAVAIALAINQWLQWCVRHIRNTYRLFALVQAFLVKYVLLVIQDYVEFV